jgi:hypothetical protein
MLNVLGKIIDGVRASVDQTPDTGTNAPIFGEIDDWQPYFHELASWLTRCKDLVNSLKDYPAAGKIEEVFWRTLLFDFASPGKTAPASYGDSFTAWFKATIRVTKIRRRPALQRSQRLAKSGALNSTLRTFQKHPVSSAEEHYVRAFTEELQPYLVESEPFGQAFGRFLSGRNFFLSERGFVGWVPISAQVGDQICIFRGCNIPFVIRPCDGGYTLLGDCYMHGLMYGEAIKMDHAPLEWIRLI